MGRPPKAPEDRREAKDQITVRLTGDERSQLEELADEYGETAGEVIRRSVSELYGRVFGRGKAK